MLSSLLERGVRVSNDLYIAISPTVREQLRCLARRKRHAIVDGLYSSLAVEGRPIGLPGFRGVLYAYWLEGYAFFYRELTRKELSDAGKDFGYLVFDMKALPPWIIGQLGG
jgi:hypothetical protein